MSKNCFGFVCRGLESTVTWSKTCQNVENLSIERTVEVFLKNSHVVVTALPESHLNLYIMIACGPSIH